MNVVLAIRGETIMLMMRGESKSAIGDLFKPIHPGDSFFGWTYRELLALGSGPHTLEPK